MLEILLTTLLYILHYSVPTYWSQYEFLPNDSVQYSTVQQKKKCIYSELVLLSLYYPSTSIIYHTDPARSFEIKVPRGI